MTCTSCRCRLEMFTADGIAFQACGCGERPVPRIVGPVRRLPDNPIGPRSRPKVKKYRRVSLAKAEEIRAVWLERGRSFEALAREFGVDGSTIARIIKHESHRQIA